MSQQRNCMRPRSIFEVMESRSLMAADVVVALDSVHPTAAHPTSGQVYLRVSEENQASDVNLDGLINLRDANSVVGFLNSRDRQLQTPEGELAAQKLDTNGDGEVGPLDVLWIVNQINEYDPLTPCNCGACQTAANELRCENVSIAQTQSANLLANSSEPSGEFAPSTLESLMAAQSIEDLLRNRRGEE